MSKRLAIKAVSFLWMGSLLGAGFAFLTQVILARQFGPEGLGVFAAALATVTLLTPLAGFGVAQFWLKVFGAEGWGAIRWLRPSLKFVVINSVVAFALLVVWSVLSPGDEESRYVLLVLSLCMFGQVSIELVSAKLQLEEKFIFLSVWQLLPHLLRLLLVVILAYVVTEFIQVVTVAYIYTLVSIVFVAAGLYLLNNMKLGKFLLKGHEQAGSFRNDNARDKVDCVDVILQSWPFGLAGLFVMVYMQIDIIFVKYIVGSEAAGQYSVAYSVMAAVYLLPTVIYQKFLLPKIHRWANHDRERFYQVYSQGNIVMFVLGVIAMLMILSLSGWVIPVLYGTEYFESIHLLNILAVGVPVFFLASSVGATLVTQDHMKRKVKYMGLVGVINIVLNFLLIPEYGAVGAAIATVISNIVLLMIYYVASRKYVFVERKELD